MKKRLLITGVAGELGGQALAEALARPDVDQVIATTRMRSIASPDPRCVVVAGLDLALERDSAALRDRMLQDPEAHWGLIHCAGLFPAASPLHRIGLEAVAATFASNALSFIGAAKAILPIMRKARCGGLIAFTSHTQGAAYPFLGPFNLSKTALLSAVQTIANENARFAIAANAIAVATLQTETERRIKPAGAYQDWISARELASYAIDLALSASPAVNGSEIQFWRHSDSYFGQSVFQRNSLDPQELDGFDD